MVKSLFGRPRATHPSTLTQDLYCSVAAELHDLRDIRRFGRVSRGTSLAARLGVERIVTAEPITVRALEDFAVLKDLEVPRVLFSSPDELVTGAVILAQRGLGRFAFVAERTGVFEKLRLSVGGRGEGKWARHVMKKGLARGWGEIEPLVVAAAAGRSDAVNFFLSREDGQRGGAVLAAGCEIFGYNPSGDRKEIVLAVAAQRGHREIVEALVGDTGAKGLNTALLKAVGSKNRAIADFCLARGATDLNGAMTAGVSVRSRGFVEDMIARGADDWDRGLFASVVSGDVEFAALFIAKGAKNTSLCLLTAIVLKRYEIARLLIECTERDDAESPCPLREILRLKVAANG